jgi:DNA replication protein DnaC
MRKATQALAERLRQVLETFKLRSTAKLMAPRLVEAGFEDAVPVVLDLLETEAKERLDRKRERLLRASHLPPGKTFETRCVSTTLRQPLLAFSEPPRAPRPARAACS